MFFLSRQQYADINPYKSEGNFRQDSCNFMHDFLSLVTGDILELTFFYLPAS